MKNLLLYIFKRWLNGNINKILLSKNISIYSNFIIKVEWHLKMIEDHINCFSGKQRLFFIYVYYKWTTAEKCFFSLTYLYVCLFSLTQSLRFQVRTNAPAQIPWKLRTWNTFLKHYHNCLKWVIVLLCDSSWNVNALATQNVCA